MTALPARALEDVSDIYTVLKSLNFKQELIYGSIAGAAITLVGHPFDTIKTCLQANGESLSQTLKNVFRHYGALGLYRGLLPPLLTSAFLNAITFGSYESSRVMISWHYKLPIDNYTPVMLAGAVSGFLCSIVITPIELFKVQLQLETQNGMHSTYSEVWRKVLRSGGASKFFRGLPTAMVRDTFAYPFQFGGYILALKYLAATTPDGSNRFWHYMIGGALGGVACWTSTYPLDTAKIIILTKHFNDAKGLSFPGEAYAVLRDVYKARGVTGWFAGYFPTIGRAICANAVGFLVWESSKSVLKY